MAKKLRFLYNKHVNLTIKGGIWTLTSNSFERLLPIKLKILMEKKKN